MPTTTTGWAALWKVIYLDPLICLSDYVTVQFSLFIYLLLTLILYILVYKLLIWYIFTLYYKKVRKKSLNENSKCASKSILALKNSLPPPEIARFVGKYWFTIEKSVCMIESLHTRRGRMTADQLVRWPFTAVDSKLPNIVFFVYSIGKTLSKQCIFMFFYRASFEVPDSFIF